MKHGLIAHGRIGKNYDHGWQSRDTKDVDCKATGCMFNIAEKCAVPSHCKITATGSCEGFKAKPMPPKVDGD